MGGRGSAGNRNSEISASARLEEGNSFRTDRNLYSRSQADELTKDYTPEQFLGDINNFYGGTLKSLQYAAEENAPEHLNIGGYTFQNMGQPHTAFEQTGRSTGKDIIMLDYQSTEQVGNEYPVLQVGIRVWRTKGGKVKSEIIRDGYTYKTRFW